MSLLKTDKCQIERFYVDAVRVIGCRDLAIIPCHILPNAMAPVIILSTLGIARVVITGAALSFLGLGAQPPTLASPGLVDYHLPGLAIMITVLSINTINMLGDGLRGARDPRLRI